MLRIYFLSCKKRHSITIIEFACTIFLSERYDPLSRRMMSKERGRERERERKEQLFLNNGLEVSPLLSFKMIIIKSIIFLCLYVCLYVSLPEDERRERS